MADHVRTSLRVCMCVCVLAGVKGGGNNNGNDRVRFPLSKAGDPSVVRTTVYVLLFLFVFNIHRKLVARMKEKGGSKKTRSFVGGNNQEGKERQEWRQASFFFLFLSQVSAHERSLYSTNRHPKKREPRPTDSRAHHLLNNIHLFFFSLICFWFLLNQASIIQVST